MRNVIKEFLRVIRERNDIERAKLALEREAFEFNKQLDINQVQANVDMAKYVKENTDKLQLVDKNIRELANNDMYFKQEIDRLKNTITLINEFKDEK